MLLGCVTGAVKVFDSATTGVTAAAMQGGDQVGLHGVAAARGCASNSVRYH